jgi:hypothetical protein
MTAEMERQTAIQTRQQEVIDKLLANKAATGNILCITGDRPPVGSTSADNAKFRADAKARFNALLNKLPFGLGAKLRGDQLPPEVEAAFNRLGQLMGNISNAGAQRLQVAAGGLEVARRTAAPASAFDTRLAPQMFGATNRIQEDQLKTQKKIEANTRRRGGLPVV